MSRKRNVAWASLKAKANRLRKIYKLHAQRTLATFAPSFMNISKILHNYLDFSSELGFSLE